MQNEITQPGPLLSDTGSLTQIGWARHPYLHCNLENLHIYPFQVLQRVRVKQWDYYAIFMPGRFFSATIADLGYAGNIFVYTLEYATGRLHEQSLVVPLSKGIILPPDSTQGIASFTGNGVELKFTAKSQHRQVSVEWPAFDQGRGISAALELACPAQHESMTIVIPFSDHRFYYNRKINCLPVSGSFRYGDETLQLTPQTTSGSLDWGRGVWPYQSFWNWASASGFLADGRRLGLNLGAGFGDLSQATENCLILDGVIHKLDQVSFDYSSKNFMEPWRFSDSEGRLALTFTPFKERIARSNLGIIFSEVHQIFGRYTGMVIDDQGEKILINQLVGFAEEHQARW